MTSTVAVPCGSHVLAQPGQPQCRKSAPHPNAEYGMLVCLLREEEHDPCYDPRDGHWRVTPLGVTELSRCQQIVSAS